MALGSRGSAPPRALTISTHATGIVDGGGGRPGGASRAEEEDLSRKCPIRWLPESPGWTVFHLPSTPDGISNTVRPRASPPLAAAHPADIVGATTPSFPPPRAAQAQGERSAATALAIMQGFGRLSSQTTMPRPAPMASDLRHQLPLAQERAEEVRVESYCCARRDLSYSCPWLRPWRGFP